MAEYLVEMHDGELYHHGIVGMKWGKRNGPPYPLGASDHSAAEQKAGWRKSLAGKASALGASNVKRALTKQRAKRDYKSGKIDKAEYKARTKEAQRVNNKETWDVLASGSRQRRLDKLNKSAEKKLNKNEKERERIMNARQKSRDFYEKRYDKKIEKGKMDEETKKAKLKDFDLGSKAVNEAYDLYWNTYSNRANEKAKAILDPSNKKSESYQKAAKEYTKQWMNEYIWYGKAGTVTNYASEAARSYDEYSDVKKKKK